MDLEARLADLEKRVAELEKKAQPSKKNKKPKKYVCCQCGEMKGSLPLEDGRYICEDCAQVMSELAPN